jgi:hypothetical protein
MQRKEGSSREGVNVQYAQVRVLEEVKHFMTPPHTGREPKIDWGKTKVAPEGEETPKRDIQQDTNKAQKDSFKTLQKERGDKYSFHHLLPRRLVIGAEELEAGSTPGCQEARLPSGYQS